MLLIGTEVKPFKANAYHNGEFIQVTDESLKGKWSVVCFYPADFTFVCPTELEDLQNQYATLKDLGVEVYSVSTDTHFTHKAWHDSSETIGKIEYIMIGDPTRTITTNFNVLMEEEGLAARGTFIIDPHLALSNLWKSMLTVSAVTQAFLLTKLKLLNTYVTTQVKFAQLNGKRVLQHLNQALTL